MHTLHSKLLLVAGHTEVLVLLRDETLGTDWLLASLAGEAGLMPAVALVLHLPGAFRKSRWKRQQEVKETEKEPVLIQNYRNHQ